MQKGANAETLCVAPRSSVHCSQALESRLSGLHSHGGYTLPFPCLHSSAAEKSERPDVCMLQKKIHKAPNAKDFFIHWRRRLLRWEEMYSPGYDRSSQSSRQCHARVISRQSCTITIILFDSRNDWWTVSLRRTNRQSQQGKPSLFRTTHSDDRPGWSAAQERTTFAITSYHHSRWRHTGSTRFSRSCNAHAFTRTRIWCEVLLQIPPPPMHCFWKFVSKWDSYGHSMSGKSKGAVASPYQLY